MGCECSLSFRSSFYASSANTQRSSAGVVEVWMRRLSRPAQAAILANPAAGRRAKGPLWGYCWQFNTTSSPSEAVTGIVTSAPWMEIGRE
jgi:hypothetical protein